jgi:hypothetical protein
MKHRQRPQRISVDQIAALIQGRPGLWILQYLHDDGCPAQHTQRIEDCVCDVEVRLVRPFSDRAARSEVRP